MPTAVVNRRESFPTARSRKIFSFSTVLIMSLVLLVLLSVRKSMAEPDFWWHLRDAEALVTTGHFPTVDTYTFTATGAHRVPQEWLAELAFYAAFRFAGLTGTFVLTLALSEAILLGVLYLAYLHSGDVKNSFLLCILAVLLATVSLGPRTLLFGWLLLLSLLIVLHRVRAGRRRLLWIIPPIFALWVNTHASWPIGFVVLALFIASGLLDFGPVLEKTHWSPGRLRALLITAAASVAALLLNPSGYRMLLYPFDLLFRRALNTAAVEEWQSVDFQTPRGHVVLIFLVLTLLVAVCSRRRWGAYELGLVLVAVCASVTYQRQSFLAALLAIPVLAGHVKLLPPTEQDAERPALNAVLVLVLLALMAVLFPRPTYLRQQLDSFFPVRAVGYMKDHNIRGRVFNYYVWGGYLIWHDRDVPVFIDGRAEIFARNGVFNDYGNAITLADPLRIFDRYRIDYVLVPSDSGLAHLLTATSGWVLEYGDRVAVLFRKVPKSAALP